MNIFCEECGKNIAAVFLTRISGNEVMRAQLCEDCARRMEEAAEAASLLALIPHAVSGIQPDEGGLAEEVFGVEVAICERCGTSFNDFRKMGFLGCQECYPSFGDALERVILESHGACEHTGKIPGNLSGGARLRRKMIELERHLERQIVEERYEDAAAARDRIREIEKILRGEGKEGEKD